MASADAAPRRRSGCSGHRRPSRLDRARDLREARLVEIGDDDVRALAGEPEGDGVADAVRLRGAGDDRDPAGERHRCPHAVSPRARRRAPAGSAAPTHISWTCGSSASRIASPTRLNAITVRTSAALGKTVSQGASRSTSRPLSIMLPQVGVGSVMPSPRKLSIDSVRIAAGTRSVQRTMTGSTPFGRTWRRRMRPVPGAGRPRGLDVLALAHGERGRPRDAGELRDVAEADAGDDGGEPRAEGRHDGEREDQCGERLEHVDAAHEEIARRAAEVARGEADERAGERR